MRGTFPGDIEFKESESQAFKVVLSVGTAAGLVFAAFYEYIGDPTSAIAVAVSALVFSSVRFFYAKTGNLALGLQIAGINTYLVLTFLSYQQGGFLSPTMWWLIVVPLGFLTCGRGGGAVYFWTTVIVFTVFFFYMAPVPSPAVESYIKYDLEYRVAIMVGLFVVLIVFLSYVSASRKSAIKKIVETSDGLREAAVALKQSNTALGFARDQAVEQAELKSRLMANISHELRTPLTGVLASIDLLSLTEMDKYQRELVSSLSQCGHHFISIINDVLDFSKLEAGMMNLSLRVVDLREFVEELRALFQGEAQRKQLQLLIQIDSTVPPKVEIDDKRLRQIIINLLSNAIKFTESGSISLLVSAGEWRASEPVKLQFQMTDTGVGIPLQAQEHLFDAFYQVDSSLSRSAGGTGLGLAICAELAKLMGGSIDVNSELGCGSTFICELPAIAFAAEIESDPIESDSALDENSKVDNCPDSTGIGGVGRKFLIVDDEPMNLNLLHSMVSKLGYQADTASNGEEAIEATRKRHYDLILMDCRMPVLDGIEATKVIRSDERVASGRNSKIVALTGDAREDIYERCLDAGMDVVMSKPFRYGDIRDVINTMTIADSGDMSAGLR